MRVCPKLSEGQLAELKNWLRSSKDASEVKRVQAVILINAGEDPVKISNLTGYSRSQIFSLRRQYLTLGIESLKTKRKGEPKTLLTGKQRQTVVQTVKGKKPNNLGYQSKFWTTGILADWIEREFKVKYKSKTSYYIIFKRVKFTYHKPGRVFEKRDETEVKEWRKQTRPIIGKVWNDSDIVILAADEMILSTQTTFQKIWLPQGDYPKIEISNTRGTVGIYGFLKVRKIYPEKQIFLLWDNPGWHKGSRVVEFIEKDAKIKAVFFPKYAPETNPQEHVWKDGRSQITHNRFIGNLKAVAGDFTKYLNSTKFSYSLLDFKSDFIM